MPTWRTRHQSGSILVPRSPTKYRNLRRPLLATTLGIRSHNPPQNESPRDQPDSQPSFYKPDIVPLPLFSTSRSTPTESVSHVDIRTAQHRTYPTNHQMAARHQQRIRDADITHHAPRLHHRTLGVSFPPAMKLLPDLDNAVHHVIDGAQVLGVQIVGVGATEELK